MFYYFGFYKSKYIENNYPSGNINAISYKMGYIINKIKKAGIPLTVISSYLSDKQGFYPYKKVVVDKFQTDCYLPSLRIMGFFKKITGIFKKLAIFLFCFFKLKKNDVVLIYHDPQIDKIFVFLKRLKGFKLIVEIEEICHRNSKLKNAKRVKANEEKAFKAADAYIVVNDLIYSKYLNNNKPHIVIYGAYDVSVKTDFEEKYALSDKEKINILFSGSIDKVRGASLAVKTAEFLPDNYVMNISGFGNPVELADIQQLIEQHNQNGKGCRIIMHGQLSAQKLDELAFACDIGLNLQDINNPFEEVSFPSKISFYLLHGLNVVSTKMSSVMVSKLSKHLYYCDMQPQAVAKAIVDIKTVDKANNNTIIRKLDNDVVKEVYSLLYEK
ncbi:MAG: hypothetical protein J6I80_04100 [Clostridia bacterium]|nr:hypothetical protein [Clostridia bacterium]